MSNPSWPPNAMDLAIAPRTRPSAARTRNCTPISAAKSAFEKVENIRLKNPPNAFSTRRIGRSPTRRAPPNAVASASDDHPQVVADVPERVRVLGVELGDLRLGRARGVHGVCGWGRQARTRYDSDVGAQRQERLVARVEQPLVGRPLVEP